MKNETRTALIALSITAVLLGSLVYIDFKHAMELDELENNISLLEDSKLHLQGRISQLEGSVFNLSQQLGILENKTASLQDLNLHLQGRISSLEDEVLSQGREIESLENNLSQLENSNTELNLTLEKTANMVEELQKEVDSLKEVKKANIEIPAVEIVDEMPRRGVLFPVEISLERGKKGINVEISEVFTGGGMDEAAYSAVTVAGELMNTTFDGYQVFFKFSGPRSKALVPPLVIDGESGGAALTVALVSALTGYPIDSNATLTGTIELSHDVGVIGGVRAKAIAARDAGYKKMLVPKSNLIIAPEIGIELVPVSTIEEVLEIMLIGYKEKA